ncbi:MAG: DUF6530 family protein [Spirochaeta sp.]
MKIPTSLKHKPVFVCENYEKIDGRYAGQTDVQGVSLGLAQWNDRGKVDISAKVWRHTGEKWSRQSEELPIHRVLDLAIMIIRSKLYMQDAYRYPDLHDPDNPDIDRIGLQGDAMTVSVCTGNPMLADDIKLFRDEMARDDELISERLHVLSGLLRDGNYGSGS